MKYGNIKFSIILYLKYKDQLKILSIFFNTRQLLKLYPYAKIDMSFKYQKSEENVLF